MATSSKVQKRNITQTDLDNTRRLSAIWKAKKQELNLTQTKLAAMMGYKSQSAVAQYLNGDVQLNMDAIIRFAQCLGVEPKAINPELSFIQVLPRGKNTRRVPILWAMSCRGVSSTDSIEITAPMDKQLYAVDVDTDGFEPYARKGAKLIVCGDEEPVSGDIVFIRYRLGDESPIHSVAMFVTNDLERQVAVTRTLDTRQLLELPLDSIDMLDPIESVEQPKAVRPKRERP